MPPVLPDPGFRLITIVVRPGEDVEIDWTGFAHYEAEAVLKRAFDLVQEDEDDQFVLGAIASEDEEEGEGA